MTKLTYFTDKGYKIKGVVHVGTHAGDEAVQYENMGIDSLIGFEPIPEWQERAYRAYSGHCYQVALSDYDGKANFYITDDGGFGQCSSLYEPRDLVGGRIDGVEKEIEVNVRRFDSWSNDHFYNDSGYDALVVDTQGSEFEVLRGFGERLEKFKYLVVEMSIEPLYVGGMPAYIICKWLDFMGFDQLSPIEEHDVLFLRKGLQP
jgi:FkbM family methyltransferase